MKDLFKIDNSTLPESWESKMIEQLFDFFGGFSASRSQLTNIGSLYLHYGDIHILKKNYINVDEDEGWLPRLDKDPSTFKEHVFLQNGDIVFADASEDYDGIGKSVVIENPSSENFVSGLHTIIARDKSAQLDIKFKRYCFSTNHVRKQFRALATGTSVYGISKSNIGKVVILIPSIREQEIIADILSTVDQQIENTDQLIEKTKELKKGIMQKLLTKGINHNEFKKTEFGEIPNSWDLIPLEYLSEHITYGFTNPMPETKNGPFMITAKDIINGKINYDTVRKTDIDKFENELTSKSKPVINDLLITKDGTLGRLAIVDKEDICINQSVATLRIKHDLVDVRFIYYLLSSNKVQQRILFDAGGSTIKHIYITKLGKMEVPIPQSKEEQLEIVKILSTIDAKIDLLVANQKKFKLLKKGLMQKLLTGKIRVRV
ncbi:restriction endonuclease subunit S [Cytobacillus sp. FJAT-54145]|uniref:Restriction endonuclease subunit S n=1 Tax=Cytobacillus spartinae TaxID=3299023 RepID=A0ABW6KIL2_9BACI